MSQKSRQKKWTNSQTKRKVNFVDNYQQHSCMDPDQVPFTT